MVYHVTPRAKPRCPRSHYGVHNWTPWYPVPDDSRVLARFCDRCLSEHRMLKSNVRKRGVKVPTNRR